MTDFNKYIGQRFKDLRRERGLSATQVAEALGVPLDMYRQSEMGLRRIPVSEIFASKKHFNMSIEEFFTHDGHYISDLANDMVCSDISDVIHYFSNIEDTCQRRSLLSQIKNASSVF